MTCYHPLPDYCWVHSLCGSFPASICPTLQREISHCAKGVLAEDSMNLSCLHQRYWDALCGQNCTLDLSQRISSWSFIFHLHSIFIFIRNVGGKWDFGSFRSFLVSSQYEDSPTGDRFYVNGLHALQVFILWSCGLVFAHTYYYEESATPASDVVWNAIFMMAVHWVPKSPTSRKPTWENSLESITSPKRKKKRKEINQNISIPKPWISFIRICMLPFI